MSESRASNCLLAVNDARWGGGASRGNLTACVVPNNTAEFGGGMYGGIASNCLFIGNLAQHRGAPYYGGQGGGVYAVSNYNNVMARNRSDKYGGGGVYRGAVYNSIIYYNFCTNAWYDSTNVWGPDEMKFSCSSQTNILSGEYYTNNIIDPPQFVDMPSLDLRLAASLPCIDTGDPADPEGADFNGAARPLDGNADGMAVADMGAYEYASPLADTDGDDMNDAGEVLAGTNPRDDHSYLHVGSVGRDGVPAGSLWVKWGRVEGRSYDLALSTNLMSDAFGLVVLTNVAATPPLNVVTTAPSVDFTNAFYRIQLGE